MVGLSGQVRGQLVVDAVLGEGRVAHVAPEHRRHAQPVRLVEGGRDLADLAVRLGGAEVDGGAEGDRTQLPRLPHSTESDLVVLVGIGEQLVVVELDEEWDPVGVATGDDTESAERGGDGAATAFDGELDQVAGVEVGRMLGEARRTGVLDALIDREDRQVAGAAQPPVVVHRSQVADDRDGGGEIDGARWLRRGYYWLR